MNVHFTVVGAGIVGAATALELIRRQPRAQVTLVEKENEPALHQSGRNSGVVHAGVYYEPGSLKARFCREGLRETREFCEQHRLPYLKTGKLIVATNTLESRRLEDLFERCRRNGLEPRMLNAGQLSALEPAVTGAAAIRVDETAVTDFARVCAAMIDEFRERGGDVRLGEAVTGIEERADRILLHTQRGRIESERLVACAGLSADRLAALQGLDRNFRTVPYRGEYFALKAHLNGLIKHLVYPVPDPALPFLGVHLTRTLDGTITVGPNAVQAFKREGYSRFAFSPADSLDFLAFPGWWKLTGRHLGAGLKEMLNSLWKRGYLKQVQKYCPRIELDDLLPHPPGIRAQAVDRDGTMIHDFIVQQTPRSLHLCNAPSPAATSAIPISRHVCDLLLPRS